MKLRIPPHIARRRMPLHRPKMARKLNLSLRRQIFEILIPEDNELALRGVQRQIVQSRGGELGELDAMDFAADVGRYVF